jgi:hypothetical protein
MVTRGALLKAQLEIVERHAYEIGVTALIQGMPVRGVLTPWIRYERWHRDIFGGREKAIPGAELALLTKAQRDEVKKIWLSSHPDGAVAAGEYTEDALLALMNAEILAPDGTVAQRLPFLLVHLGSIDALSFVQVRPGRNLLR